MKHAAESIAKVFGLGRSIEPLTPVQHTSFETWRLRTASADYLVKRLWGLEDPPWWTRIEQGMALEAAALAQGLPIARPVEPTAPAFGYAARVDDFGTVRLYDWIDHRTLTPADDVAAWLGRVAARLHGLMPLTGVQPEWRWWGVFPRDRWEEWAAIGRSQDKPWADALAEKVGFFGELGRSIQAAFTAADDQVLSHGDLEPYNVLVSAEGPVLIDWESVACESATLEFSRAALSFGGDDPARISRILQKYVDSGGTLAAIGDDLFLRTVSLHLCHLAERLDVEVGKEPPPGWMQGQDLTALISQDLQTLPQTVHRLRTLATACLG
ncbi:phosphotransferase family protein [Kribbella jiaozuonensis]|uniref:phosphotransferase family protein n=1 Tax=Kribbella jiaozuonensis TaxID=2575441 RepID=UPI00148532D7|nr:phosphotransferase [Kribbella jiaozuonensis]